MPTVTMADLGNTLEERTLAASERALIFAAKTYAKRRTLFIRNRSLTDALYMRQTDSATGKKIQIEANTWVKFDPILTYHRIDTERGIVEIINYCEWQGDVYLENSSALNTLTFEAL